MVKWRALDKAIIPERNYPTPGEIYFGKIRVEKAEIEVSPSGHRLIVKGEVIT